LTVIPPFQDTFTFSQSNLPQALLTKARFVSNHPVYWRNSWVCNHPFPLLRKDGIKRKVFSTYLETGFYL